ncbi:hypothetical protein G7072_03905 [Nocardioides sp. HDW12B]|uniref:Rv3235 family protein n=1 Tax=Nocardioides sp. HDW12B TaxID=2714939 RepID=UPI00140781CD|nr:Rv3235 family protein [Nocardioides sp. HDW12B]QIK65593.1 hypothetical protein G7072_03905 [Nocardioides sp. HDW12B]
MTARDDTAATRRATASVAHLPRPRTRPEGVPAGPVVQGSLALSWAPVEARPRPVRVSDEDSEITALARRFAQAAVEVVAGQRPVLQLLRWTDEHVYADLERRASLVRQARGSSPRRVHAQVRSVHVCRPHDDSAEVSVHVRHGERSRALALRLERHRDRWRCTVLQFG